MIKGLKPILEEHSIKNAEAQIYIPQAFLKPQDIFLKLKESELFKDFHKKDLIGSAKLSFKNDGIDINSSSNIIGFIFEKFKDDSIKDVFKLENLPDNSRSKISISTRKYSRWSNFKEEQLKLILDASKYLNIYINAIGFTYTDEFKWDGKGLIPVKEIFNTNSELLNTKFLNSKNGTLVLLSQGDKDDKLITEEKTELIFNNDLRRVQITHQFLIKLENSEKISDSINEEAINQEFDYAHEEHKSFLGELLTKKCKNMINFKD